MTTNETPTPRTDNYVAEHYNVRIFDAQHCFDFARQLERELATVKAQLEQANIRGDYWERKCLEDGPK